MKHFWNFKMKYLPILKFEFRGFFQLAWPGDDSRLRRSRLQFLYSVSYQIIRVLNAQINYVVGGVLPRTTRTWLHDRNTPKSQTIFSVCFFVNEMTNDQCLKRMWPGSFRVHVHLTYAYDEHLTDELTWTIFLKRPFSASFSLFSSFSTNS